MTSEITRLFFALWPTPEISQFVNLNNEQIHNLVTGNFVKQSNWHITLAFLGNVDTKTKLCLIDKANKIQNASFSIEFNSVGFFQKPKILYYGADKNSTVNNLSSLVYQCKEIQDECGLESDPREFVPHITIVRKAKQPEHAINIKPFTWQAKEFVLVSSQVTAKGSYYTVINRWPLLST